MSVKVFVRNWRITLRIALVLLAFLLSLFCVLAGVRPNWLSELYLVRVSSILDAAASCDLANRIPDNRVP